MATIQYIGNTCDHDELSGFGEQFIIIKNDKVVFLHDYSDGALEIDYIQNLFEALDINIVFEEITPTKKQYQIIKDYLISLYGPVEWDED